MSDFDQIIFGNKKYSDLVKEIYNRSAKKEKESAELVEQLKSMISNLSDAMIVVPLVNDYLKISLQANEHLVKLAGILQKAIETKKTTGEEPTLSDEELHILQLSAEDLAKGTPKLLNSAK